MGFENYDNNRSTRLKKLIEQYDKIDYECFKKSNMIINIPNHINLVG